MASILRRPFQYRYYNATIILIVACVLAFLAGFVVSPRSLLYLSLIPNYVLNTGAWWQVVTYMFLHATWSHIFWNMLGLFIFGIQLERRMGSTEFLLFYVLCGIGAGVATVLINSATGQGDIPIVGASGAVYAVELAFAAFFPDARIFILGILPVRAPLLVTIVVAIELFSQLTGVQAGVAHLTHLAGFVFAFLYLLVRYQMNAVSIFLNRR